MPSNAGYLEAESGIKLVLGNKNLIGRSSRGKQVDIDLSALDTNRLVSREHALIRRSGERYIIQDNKSRNGVWINGKVLESGAQIALSDGVVIDFGPAGRGVRLKFVYKG